MGLTNLPALDGGPLELLDPNGETGQGGQNDDGLEPHLLSLVELGLRGPGEEGSDVLGHLGRGRLRSVGVLDEAVVEHAAHADRASREVRVVVETLTDLDTCRRVYVAGDEGVDVVLHG